mgnify:CR=1 FL=1
MKIKQGIMLRYIYTFLFLFSSYTFFGQVATKIDTLEKEAKNYQLDDNLADWLIAQRAILKEKCEDADCKVKGYNWIIKHKWRDGKNEKEYSQIASVYVIKGYYADLGGQYLEAKKAYETFLNDPKLSSTKDENYINNYVHRDLGNIYTRLGETEKAITSLQLFLKSTDSPVSKAEVYSDLGKAYETKGNLETALDLYQKGLEIRGLPNETRGLLYGSLLWSYYEKKDYSQVIINGEKALQLLKKRDGISNSWVATIYSIMGLAYAQLDKKQASKTAFEQALRGQQIEGQSIINRELAKLYIAQGEALLILGDPISATPIFQKALRAVLPSFDEKGLNNPNEALFYPENAIVEALQGKMQALVAQYNLDQSPKYMDQALDCYALALKAEFGLRQTYQFEASQLVSVENTRKQSEVILKALYQIYKETGLQKYAEKAFEITEMTKASVLQERLARMYAQANFLSQKLQEQDYSFQKKRNEQYQRLVNEPENSASIYKEINAININYNVFLKELEANYPNYAKSKTIASTIDISTIQDRLLKNKNTALIEYYWGETAQFVFVFTQKNTIQFNKIDTKDLPQFNEFYKELHQVNNTEVSFQTLTKEGLKIYEKYIKVLKLSADIQQLIIIPDGELSHLPFEGLISKIPEVKAGRYDKLPYLGLKYRFSYSYSAAVLLKLKKQKKVASHRFLGIAPSFEEKGGAIAMRTGLSDLKHNSTEVNSISHLFADQKTFLGKDASKSHFLAAAKGYNILHLSTHATAYDPFLKQSAIYFSDSALTLQDIYTLPLDAQMVVLSACQTGTGELYTGEGVMSLARAFMAQGCPSVVSSFWNVNDERTAKIMTLFYENIQQNLPKDEALLLARKNYLAEASPAESHPFYWSAFVLIGDEIALNRSNNRYVWWILIGLIGLVGLLYFARKR